MSIDQGVLAFEVFKKKYDTLRTKDLSESDTRSKLLDYLLIDVLGWLEHDITREGHLDSGYFDYVIGTATFKFIVEAKRNLAEFKLPEKGRRFKIRTLQKGNEDIIQQARNYAIDKGVGFAVMSNGHQFIISQLVNFDGTDWRDNNAIVFRSIEDIDANFIDFYNLFSRSIVTEKGRIFDSSSSETPQIIRNVLPHRDDVVIRNELSSSLVKVIDQVFRELMRGDETSKELLETCYVKNEDVKKYNSDLKAVFEDNPPAFDARIAPVRNTDNTQEQIADQITNISGEPPSPVILIGGKGVGKTTFLNYFFNVSLPEKVKESVIWVYVDMRSYTQQSIEDTRLICKKILEKVEDAYPQTRISDIGVLKSIYEKQINSRKRGVWAIYKDDHNLIQQKIAEFIENEQADSIKHLEHVSAYFVNRLKKRLCLIFDNADQLSEESQKQAFILAQSLYRSLGVTMLLSLREGYFYRWKDKPPFDAYPSTVFHISAPLYREVLRRRFDYIAEKYKFPPVKGVLKDSMSVTIDKDALPRLFSNLSHTMFGYKNSEVLQYLEQTSYPNIRSGLEKLNAFLVSGHTKIVSYAMSPNYRIPVWEFVKSVGLDSNLYYHHDTSHVFNLYYPAPGGKSHFLKIRLLLTLLNKCKGDVSKNEFVFVEEIVNEYIRAGYSADNVFSELSLLLIYGMIETNQYGSDVESDSQIFAKDNIRITYVGAYYARELCGRFFYLDLVLQDTPIYGTTEFDKIRHIFPHADQYGNRRLDSRAECVRLFVEYLRHQEELEVKRTVPSSEDTSLTYQIVANFESSVLKSDLDAIKRISDQMELTTV